MLFTDCFGTTSTCVANYKDLEIYIILYIYLHIVLSGWSWTSPALVRLLACVHVYVFVLWLTISNEPIQILHTKVRVQPSLVRMRVEFYTVKLAHPLVQHLPSIMDIDTSVDLASPSYYVVWMFCSQVIAMLSLKMWIPWKKLWNIMEQ